MISAISIYPNPPKTSMDRLNRLQQQLLLFSFFNLFLVATSGLFMRGFPFLHSFFLPYKNLLHAHSHFAFGGWVMPILTWMIIQFFPAIKQGIHYRHWRNIIILVLVSAYGMLASFPFQGYGLVSIIFSTLSVIAGFYLAFAVWKVSGKLEQTTSIRFLQAGLFYLVLSSLGPFATGPLIALGKAGSPIYFNAIYFYLHFQYNGWFSFAILAVLYAIMEKKGGGARGQKVYYLFNLACIPAYFLSVLWTHPHPAFYWIGGCAALMQLAGICFLAIDFANFTNKPSFFRFLMNLAFAAFVIKNVLQFLSALPVIANLAYQTRNFIIAYLHLVLLGFITLMALSMVLRSQPGLMNRQFRTAIILFLVSFISTELMLALEAFGSVEGWYIPNFTMAIFVASCFFPLGAFLAFFTTVKYMRADTPV